MAINKMVTNTMNMAMMMLGRLTSSWCPQKKMPHEILIIELWYCFGMMTRGVSVMVLYLLKAKLAGLATDQVLGLLGNPVRQRCLEGAW